MKRRRFLGAALPATSAASDFLCRMRPGHFDQLTLHVQAALIAKGAKIQPTGIWAPETCEAWWREMKEPLSPTAINKLRPDLPECEAMMLPVCEEPLLTLRRALQIALVGGIVYGGYRLLKAFHKDEDIR